MTESFEKAKESKMPGPAGASEPDVEHENRELDWAQRNVPEEDTPLQPVKSVFRRTELYGTTPSSAPDAIKKKRKKTIRDLKNPVGTVSYTTFETACKDFICSLMERQDLTREEMFLHVADLQQQIDVLEHRREQDRPASSDVAEVKE